MYVVKYKLEITSNEGAVYVVDILEDGYSGPVKEICGTEDPLYIEIAEEKVDSSVSGSGLTLNLISETPLQYLDLYSVDIFAHKVNLYRDSVLIWTGWLDSEMYNEEYNEFTNYPISFTANDGLSLLKRLKYRNQTTEVNYRGLETAWQAIIKILESNRVEYTSINFMTSHILINRSNQVIPAVDETLLHNVIVNQDNFIDELLEVKDSREVLESILQPFGLRLKMSLEDASLYIYDYHVLTRGADIEIKKFSLDGTHISNSMISRDDLEFDLSTYVYCNTESSQFTFTSPITRQDIKHSTYLVDKILETEFKEDDFCYYNTCSNQNGQDVHDACDDDKKWSEWFYDEIPDYEIIDTIGCKFVQKVKGVYNDVNSPVTDKLDYYIRSEELDDSHPELEIFKTTKTTPVVYAAHNVEHTDFAYPVFVVDFEFMANWDVCLEGNGTDLADFGITIKLHIGSKSLTANALFMSTLDDEGHIAEQLKSDTWVRPYYSEDITGVIFRADQLPWPVEGEVYVSVQDQTTYGTNGNPSAWFRFKNFEVKIMDNKTIYETGSPIFEDYKSNDLVVESTANNLAEKEGGQITTLLGSTNSDGIERGGFIQKSATEVGSYVYADVTEQDIDDGSGGSAKLLLEYSLVNMIVSNRNNPAITIDGVKVKYNDLSTPPIRLIKDSNYFGDRHMTPYSLELNALLDEYNLNIIEIKPTTYTVVEVK